MPVPSAAAPLMNPLTDNSMVAGDSLDGSKNKSLLHHEDEPLEALSREKLNHLKLMMKSYIQGALREYAQIRWISILQRDNLRQAWHWMVVGPCWSLLKGGPWGIVWVEWPWEAIFFSFFFLVCVCIWWQSQGEASESCGKEVQCCTEWAHSGIHWNDRDAS
ncbi:hypothetical protein BC940DRAFT_2760 [Gongronella butleri]|nr:hypothetical protein BC940DRAFT_2760 [Gongronella butleri]